MIYNYIGVQHVMRYDTGQGLLYLQVKSYALSVYIYVIRAAHACIVSTFMRYELRIHVLCILSEHFQVAMIFDSGLKTKIPRDLKYKRKVAPY